MPLHSCNGKEIIAHNFSCGFGIIFRHRNLFPEGMSLAHRFQIRKLVYKEIKQKMKKEFIISFVFIILCFLNIANAQFFQSVKVAKVGEQAPEFSLKDFQGKSFSYSKKKNDKVRIFWFTNLCSGCLSVISDMEKIKSTYEKKGVEIVAVSQLGEDKETVAQIVKERKLTLRFLYDPKGEATARYSGRYTPGTCPLKSLYIVQKNGTIQFATHFPGVPAVELANQLDKALAAK